MPSAWPCCADFPPVERGAGDTKNLSHLGLSETVGFPEARANLWCGHEIRPREQGVYRFGQVRHWVLPLPYMIRNYT
jgi:hypothetical protein